MRSEETTIIFCAKYIQMNYVQYETHLIYDRHCYLLLTHCFLSFFYFYFCYSHRSQLERRRHTTRPRDYIN